MLYSLIIVPTRVSEVYNLIFKSIDKVEDPLLAMDLLLSFSVNSTYRKIYWRLFFLKDPMQVFVLPLQRLVREEKGKLNDTRTS